MAKARKSAIRADVLDAVPALLAKPGRSAVRGVAVQDLPTPPAKAAAGGLKSATVGTTLYLLPEESKRLRRLAVDLDISLHELVLRGLDLLLDQHGQPPITRYQPKK